MKDLDLNFPLDKFEKLIIDIGWESLDDWFNFWNNQRNILSIDQYWSNKVNDDWICLLYTSPSPRDREKSRMPSSA